MKNFHRLATGIEVGPLVAKLVRNPDWWTEDTYLRTFAQGPFGEVDSIICRFPPRAVCATQEEADARMKEPGYDQHECIDQDIYGRLPEVRQIVMNLFAYTGGTRLGRVMINRIQPGGRIFKHADTPDHANYWQRHHVCLQSAPGVIFNAGDESIYMAPGEAWWFNNGKGKEGDARPEHEVFNGSAVERIHLIVDIRTS